MMKKKVLFVLFTVMLVIVSAVAGASAAENREQRTVSFNNTQWVVELASETERIAGGTKQLLTIAVVNELAGPQSEVTYVCTVTTNSDGSVTISDCIAVPPPPPSPPQPA